MSTNITAITDENFEDVIQSDSPVLVDFWAKWSQPCLRLAPILDAVAGDYQGKVQVYKMDVETNQATPSKYGIRGIPALLLYKNGELLATKIGGDLTKSHLSAFLDSHI